MSALAGNTPVLLAIVAGIVVICVVVLVMGRKIDAKVGSIHLQVHPNGGSSLADQVFKLGDAVDRAERGIVRVAKDVGAVTERVVIIEAIADRREPHPELERREGDTPAA